MVYINQIMKETLRLNDSVAKLSACIVTEDIILPSGTFITKGSHFIVNIFNLHHSNKIWKNATQFNPDRFADDGEGARGPGECLAWLPFCNGSRQCIAMKISLNEQRVMLAMLLRKYIWTLPEDSIHKDGLITAGFPAIARTTLHFTFRKRY